MRRMLIAAALAALVLAAPAGASPVLVFDNGHVTRTDDPALPPASAANPLVDAPHQCAQGPGPTASMAVVSVGKALRRAYNKGHIDRDTYSAYGDAYSSAKSTWHRLGGNRKRELAAVITTVNALAARGELSASRMKPVFLELQRNTEWWARTGSTPAPAPSEGDQGKPHKKTACTTAGRIPAGPRVRFKGDPLTLQYYPGSGLRLHPLANFGEANALYNACKGINTEPGTPCELDKLRALLDRLVATAARRGGFLAWEYYFPFGGGRPPWVSGIATGSALSALSRSAMLFKEQESQPPPAPAEPTGGSTPTYVAPDPNPHDSAYYLDVARRALPVYEHTAPTGIRLPTSHGN